jgi:hypothetical protein
LHLGRSEIQATQTRRWRGGGGPCCFSSSPSRCSPRLRSTLAASPRHLAPSVSTLCLLSSRARFGRDLRLGRVSWHCGCYGFFPVSCRYAGLSGRNHESGECFWRFRRWICNSLEDFRWVLMVSFREMLWQGRGVKADKLNALPLVNLTFFLFRNLLVGRRVIRFLWTQETVSSLKEPVGIFFWEERDELAKKESESESQGVVISFFVSLHLVYGSSCNHSVKSNGTRIFVIVEF